MNTAELVSIEKYLRSDFQPDREYIDGETQKRNLGEKDHSKMRTRLIVALANREGLDVWAEQRVQVKATRFRVPDVCVTIGEPDERIFTAPPYVVIEVLSPNDTLAHTMERIRDYGELGVWNVWIVDPSARRAWITSREALQPVETLRTEGEPEVTLEAARLFD
jgi:Uma2 family endonuclease